MALVFSALLKRDRFELIAEDVTERSVAGKIFFEGCRELKEFMLNLIGRVLNTED